MANVDNVSNNTFLPRLQKRVKMAPQILLEGNNDQALAAMLGVCFLLGIGMWTAFFMWLF